MVQTCTSTIIPLDLLAHIIDWYQGPHITLIKRSDTSNTSLLLIIILFLFCVQTCLSSFNAILFSSGKINFTSLSFFCHHNADIKLLQYNNLSLSSLIIYQVRYRQPGGKHNKYYYVRSSTNVRIRLPYL